MISSRLTVESIERIVALVAGADQDDAGPAGGGTEGEDAPPVLAKVKEAPGDVSLETMLTEIDKLLAVRAIGLPRDLFIDVAPKVVAGWRARAALESPSHLRTHPVALRVTLLTALLYEREREITDTLVELLISTVYRIGARAEKKVTEQLLNAFKKVSGGVSARSRRRLPLPGARAGADPLAVGRVCTAPSECVVVSDLGAHVEAARRAGGRGILVSSDRTRPEETAGADHVAPDVLTAVRAVLNGPPQGRVLVDERPIGAAFDTGPRPR